MASWLILLIKQFVDIFKYILIGNAIFDIEYKNKMSKNKYILIIVFTVYIVFKNIIIDFWVEFNLIIGIMCSIIYFKNRSNKVFKIVIISILIVTFLEQFIDLFITYNPTDILSFGFLFSNIVRIIFIIIISYFIKEVRLIKEKQYNFDGVSKYIYMNIIFCFSATIFPLFIVRLYSDVIDIRLFYTIITVAYINIIISLISIGVFVKNKMDKDNYYLDSMKKDQTLKLQEKYYKKLIDNYSDIRRFKHDIKGHLNIVNRLITDNNYDKAKEYISEMSKNISKNDVYKTNNIYISTILNSFDQIYKDEDINFELSYYITKHINMDSMDICSLFYNLISNAIESNLKIRDERFIKLYIAEIKNNVVIKLLNPVDESFNLNIIKENRTTKQDKENHGFGLITINNIVSKYRGSIDYDVMDTNLIIDIVLFNTLK